MPLPCGFGEHPLILIVIDWSLEIQSDLKNPHNWTQPFHNNLL